jgi:hypothetical protein
LSNPLSSGFDNELMRVQRIPLSRLPPALHFNPAQSTLFTTLSRFHPLAYRTEVPSRMPALQAAERKLMHQVRDGLSRADVEMAKDLAEAGLGPMWKSYAARISEGRSPSERNRLFDRLNDVLEAASVAVDAEKEKFRSPRPYQVDSELELFGAPPNGTSHPSGHSAIAFAAATFLAHEAPWLRGELLAAAANVARSRVVLGVHYPGDVAQGARFGVDFAKKVI